MILKIIKHENRKKHGKNEKGTKIGKCVLKYGIYQQTRNPEGPNVRSGRLHSALLGGDSALSESAVRTVLAKQVTLQDEVVKYL